MARLGGDGSRGKSAARLRRLKLRQKRTRVDTSTSAAGKSCTQLVGYYVWTRANRRRLPHHTQVGGGQKCHLGGRAEAQQQRVRSGIRTIDFADEETYEAGYVNVKEKARCAGSYKPCCALIRPSRP